MLLQLRWVFHWEMAGGGRSVQIKAADLLSSSGTCGEVTGVRIWKDMLERMSDDILSFFFLMTSQGLIRECSSIRIGEVV